MNPWHKYDSLVELQKQRNRARARRELTRLLCSGHTMESALAECQRIGGSALGIAAEAVAEEERGWVPK